MKSLLFNAGMCKPAHYFDPLHSRENQSLHDNAHVRVVDAQLQKRS